jgi:penicillin-binding protein 1C
MRTSRVLTIAEAIVLVLLGYLALPPSRSLLRGSDIVSTTVTDRNGVKLREILSRQDGVAKWVRLEDISPWLVQATVLAEDRRFFQHPGVDLRALARAVRDNLRARRIVSGGSTITQQLVHNVHGFPRRNPLLKLVEALEAVRWELHLSKHDILEAYLNRVPYGNQTFGAEAATQLYFGKSCAVLSAAEAALLAGIPQAPARYDPYRFPDRTRKRQAEILALMKKYGRLSELEHDIARGEESKLVPREQNFRAPHFIDWLMRTNRAKEPEAVLRTTLDWRIQQQVERSLRRTVRSLRGNNVTNGATIVMNPHTGEILALAGSADYFDARSDGQVNAALALRQPGSALKPFTYELALENGMTAADLLPDLELHAIEPSGDYAPRNYDEQFHGPVRLRTALACSYNIPAVRVLERFGPERLLERLHQLGFRSLNRDARHYGLALTLGVGDVTLLELCRGYACLANQGFYVPERTAYRPSPTAYRQAAKEFPPDPRPLTPDPARVLDPAACCVVTSILSDNAARIPAFGEYSPLNLDFPCAAKTGTSKDYRDNWTVGFTTEYLVGVWIGNFDGTPMHGVSGIAGAAPLFREIMQFLQPSDPPPFSEPAGVVHLPVCSRSGAPCGPDCPNAIDEIFIAGTEPREPCTVHQRYRIDRLTGLPAAPNATPGDVEDVVYEVYPALYYDWMQSVGLPLPPAGVRPEEYADAPSAFGLPPAAFRIIFPDRNSIFKLDPDLDPTFQSVQLRAEVPGECSEVSWRVDGKLFETAAYPFSCFWPLAAGRHRITCETGGLSDEVPVLVLN